MSILRNGQRADRIEHALPPGEVLLEDDEGQLRAAVLGFEESRENRAIGNLPGQSRKAHLRVSFADDPRVGNELGELRRDLFENHPLGEPAHDVRLGAHSLRCDHDRR